jgi:RNA polymerase sigma-70 factor, ECF subfamily
LASADLAHITPLRELQLVELYRKGGASAIDAVGELIKAYQRRVYSICFRMVRHHEDAADLTQDVLVKMIESLSSYNGQSKLSTWVIRVAMNCCLSHLRKQKLRDHKSIDAGALREGLPGRGIGSSGQGATSGFFGQAAGLSLSGPRSGEGREPSPSQGVEQTQRRAMVLEALNSLDAETRAILVLRDVQELDYQQLADVLEVPVGTVKSRLFRARAALRQAIEALGGE